MSCNKLFYNYIFTFIQLNNDLISILEAFPVIDSGIANDGNIVFAKDFSTPPIVILTPNNSNNDLIWSCNTINVTTSAASYIAYYASKGQSPNIKYLEGMRWVAIGY